MVSNVHIFKSSGGDGILGKLRYSHIQGDMLAPLQALKYAQAGFAAVPNWAIFPMCDVYSDILRNKQKGKPGKGNSAFGNFTKNMRHTVQASAYHYVCAWQKDPHLYRYMPRQTIRMWFDKDIDWPGDGYLAALRYTAEGLKGTAYQAQTQTIRKNAVGRVPPVVWGRNEVEDDLGLRGPSCAFGPHSVRVPPHIEKLLDKHKPAD